MYSWCNSSYDRKMALSQFTTFLLFIIVADPFQKFKKTTSVNSKEYSYYNLPEFGAEYGKIIVFIT